jgi:hypothetical protein
MTYEPAGLYWFIIASSPNNSLMGLSLMNQYQPAILGEFPWKPPNLADETAMKSLACA